MTPAAASLAVFCCCLALAQGLEVRRYGSKIKVAAAATSDSEVSAAKNKHHHPFVSPVGLFIQERASKQLPGPGQHYFFGALGGEGAWDKIHSLVDSDPNSKLILLIRHGQAMSNYLSDTLGPDDWFDLEKECVYTDKNGTSFGIFDADLTNLGEDQGRSLNSMLDASGWFNRLTNNQPTRMIVSPLSRCLETALLVSKGLNISTFDVEENARETLGEDTCDARRSVSDPDPEDPQRLEPVCPFELGLRSKFPEFRFPIIDAATRKQERKQGGTLATGFGLFSDRDMMWTKDRETQQHQTKRAEDLLHDIFAYTKEKIVFVVTHSGFTRSVLLAVGREPYRPQNTELVPVVVTKVVPAAPSERD